MTYYFSPCFPIKICANNSVSVQVNHAVGFIIFILALCC